MQKKDLQEQRKGFARLLLKWNKEKNDRQMPWKGEKDPYKIWLSEIILQQTRVEQGLGYYNKFVRAFPNVRQLAKAKDETIFKLWEGLGYYSRCRNLIATARYIAKECKGRFPDTYETILALKGVGPYTAAAISSFAYNLPFAVVDGNVFRVLARVFGINRPTDSATGKKFFSELAADLLDKKQPGLYNQAIMDFGAMICKPAAPLCHQCIFQKKCIAFQNKKVGELPVKEKKITIKKRWFYYLVLEYKNEVAIRRRTEKDIWQDLYEFPLVESAGELEINKVIQQAEKLQWISLKQATIVSVSAVFRQKLSHQHISGQFIKIRLTRNPGTNNNWVWVSRIKKEMYPFPQFINQFLQQKTETQSLV